MIKVIIVIGCLVPVVSLLVAMCIVKVIHSFYQSYHY